MRSSWLDTSLVLRVSSRERDHRSLPRIVHARGLCINRTHVPAGLATGAQGMTQDPQSERTPEELAAYIDDLTRRIKENAEARERRTAKADPK